MGALNFFPLDGVAGSETDRLHLVTELKVRVRVSVVSLRPYDVFVVITGKKLHIYIFF